MTTTTVQPGELNYDHYTSSQYDRDIVNSIPFHKEIHLRLADFLSKQFERNGAYEVIDLGTGTGISAKVVQSVLPYAHFNLVDFSAQMMRGAREKFAPSDTRFIEADYSTMNWDRMYDVVMTVIGLHHQSDEGKRELFKRVHAHLKPGGVFIIGDLVTYRDPHVAALNQARHFHHLVDKAADEQALTEWAHHHLFLNKLTPIEDLIMWLEATGFAITVRYTNLNTALIVAEKR